MSVAAIQNWRLPGCGAFCAPDHHSPQDHEAYGARRERAGKFAGVVRTGPLVIDLYAHTVTVHGEEVALTGREWEMLAYLAQRVGAPCPLREIERAIWGIGVSRLGTVRMNASRLRNKLGPAGAALIETVGNTGALRLRVVEPDA